MRRDTLASYLDHFGGPDGAKDRFYVVNSLGIRAVDFEAFAHTLRRWNEEDSDEPMRTYDRY